MRHGWRLVRAARAGTAFTGEGAALFPGRNRRGTRLVYVSAHQSLAALELLVHWRPLPARQEFAAFALKWPERITETLKKLPPDWRRSRRRTPPAGLANAGCGEARSAVLAVPSVLAPADLNYLLNPLHPDFRLIEIGPAIPFAFDPRLLER